MYMTDTYRVQTTIVIPRGWIVHKNKLNTSISVCLTIFFTAINIVSSIKIGM